uniref:IRS-type PTB domain-containing protein n=1 Tax=Macrostomum lignano TaxID=282301 RepID=A0A1I8HXK0_9PLAT
MNRRVMQSSDMLFKGPVVSGNVELFANRKLKQRYCVISKPSNFATHLKLYIFKSQAQHDAAKERGQLEPFANVYGSSNSAVRNGKSANNCIVLTCDTGIVILAMKDIHDLLSWSETIKKYVSDIDYRVRLIRTEGCRLQAGAEGRLHVQKTRLCFYTEPVENCRQLAVWSLSSVRKYWIDSDKNFVFESSRAKCDKPDKGSGVHQFESEQAEQVYNCMHAACHNKPLLSASPPTHPPGGQQPKPYALPQSSAVTYSTVYSGSTSLSMSHPLTGTDGRSHNMYHMQQRQLRQQMLLQQRQDPIGFRLLQQQQLRSTTDAEFDEAEPTQFSFEPSSPSVVAATAAAAAAAAVADNLNHGDQVDSVADLPSSGAAGSASAGAAATAADNHDYCNLRDRTSYLSMSEVHPYSSAAAAGVSAVRSSDSYVQMSSSPAAGPVGCDTIGRRRSERSSDFDSAGLSSPENQYDEVAVDSPPSSPQLGPSPSAQFPQQQQRPQRYKQRPPPLPLTLNRSQSEDPAAAESDAAVAAAELRSPTMRTRPVPQSAGVGVDGFSTLAQRKPRHGKEYISRERLISSSSDTAASPTQGLGPMAQNGISLAPQPPFPSMSYQQQPPQAQPPVYNPLRDYVNLRPAAVAAYPEEPPPRLQYAQLQHHQQPDPLYPVAAVPQLAVPAGAASIAGTSAAASSSMLQQQQMLAQLNYTELDHNKTRAFQEIAEEEESRRNPASRSASSA